MRFYTSYTNRRGKSYGAGIPAGEAVHTRGWDVGVKVTARDRNGRDEFDVYMSTGSNDTEHDVLLGTVVMYSPSDGPVFEPAATAASRVDESRVSGLREISAHP